MQQIDFDIKKDNLYEMVAEKLEVMIVSDSGQLGQKLPSEQSLANSFGVSRNVIREALKILKERGLIVLRTGEGAYISKPESQTMTNLISRMLAMEEMDGLDVHEMRVLFETESCRLSTVSASEKDFDELESIIEKMKGCYDDLNARTELDIIFHTRMADMTGNRLLSLFVQSMAYLICGFITQAIRSPGGSDNGIIYHSRIVAAMRKRNPQEAEQIMRDHLEESKQRYLRIKNEEIH